MTGSGGRTSPAADAHLGVAPVVAKASAEVELSRCAEDNAARLGARTEGPSIGDPQDRPAPAPRHLLAERDEA